MTDEELVQHFALPEFREKAFMQIVGRYKKRVYLHCRQILADHDDADDAAQNTFIKVWENLGNFRADSKLFSWIYRIATNESLTVLRKKRPGVDLDDAMPELADLTSAGHQPDGEKIEHMLFRAVSTLPVKQKLVFVLKYYEDLTYEEIAEITETSVGALKASYFHAVKKIEEYIQRPV